jgi:toxin ParE1/3/4
VKPVIFADEAEAELAEAIDYANARRTGGGDRLREAVEQAVRLIQRFPGIGGAYGRTPYRKFIVQRTWYTLYYQEFGDAIWIAAVAHQKRRPGYWLGRSRGDAD